MPACDSLAPLQSSVGAVGAARPSAGSMTGSQPGDPVVTRRASLIRLDSRRKKLALWVHSTLKGLGAVDRSKAVAPRSCAGCGRLLSRYNNEAYCGGCAHGGPRNRSVGVESAGVTGIGARNPPNLILRQLRENQRHETRREFAEALEQKAREIGESVHPSERYIARLEDGDIRYPHPPYRRALTALYGKSMQELGFARAAFGRSGEEYQIGEVSRGNLDVTEQENAEAKSASIYPMFGGNYGGLPVFTGIDDMNRRELLRIMSIVGALTTTGYYAEMPEWDPVSRLVNNSTSIDVRIIDGFAALDDHLWRVFVLSRVKQAVFPLARDHLDVLVNNISEAGNAANYKRLCGLASSAFQLCGEILFDGNMYTEAAHCYALAATAGKEAGLNDLWACALTRHAFIGLYERRYDRAAPLLELAAGLARRGDQTLATRYWVAVVQAQAFAGLGDLAACQRALDVAGEVHGLSGDIHNGGWLRFDESRLAEERGTSYLQLRHLDLAETALTDALCHNLSARRRGSVLTDLAILGIYRQDLDQAMAYADAVAQLVRQTSSGFIARKLRGLQPYLQPLMNDSRVRDLNERINALASQTAAV